MVKVSYTAKNYSGEIKSGEIEVKDEKDLAKILRSENYVLTSFKELETEKKSGNGISFWDRFSTIPLSEKLMFTRNLSVMVGSGLPISKSLKNLAVQTKNKKFQAVLKNVQDDVQSGNQLSDGLGKFPGIFNELFVNMIRVGETGGNLEQVLAILALQMEKDHDILRKTKGALVYPAVILVAMIGIGFLMMIFVIPQITAMFKDFDAELPMSTKTIIFLSNLFENHWLLMLIGIAVFVMLVYIFLKTEAGKRTLGFISINFPGVSNIVIKLNCARFCRIYSSLLGSGVPVVESLKILSKTLGNFRYKKVLTKASEGVQRGESLSSIIYTEKKAFPVLVPQMIEVGEETGKTEEVLAKLADFYEQEVDQLTKNLSSIIEPILMIFIGTAVGFFAISILQPMYSVMENIK
jgi:type IV pilus assembly protein PilC